MCYLSIPPNRGLPAFGGSSRRLFSGGAFSEIGVSRGFPLTQAVLRQFVYHDDRNSPLNCNLQQANRSCIAKTSGVLHRPNHEMPHRAEHLCAF